MPLALDNLWREVLRRSAQRKRSVRHLLRKPKVGHLHVALVVQQQVLRLQVAVDHVQRMQILEGQHKLRVVELCHVVREPPRRAQMCEHLTAHHEL
ncbi:hypothetical protein ABL78_8577 [Leptomonas seymouri]|uniref:Uncharacterized protein n=1 Tax=Leptomonas seymouri TaxID=5684 RepID=A0A0N1IGY1_LEPSE|nr:hypothetical protein ABL78_8577 [Leptomonas seymouri]|eukprot:KPI82413.1 hypothetical protein ABL78_8577 [Leptomonas seymouri]